MTSVEALRVLVAMLEAIIGPASDVDISFESVSVYGP